MPALTAIRGAVAAICVATVGASSLWLGADPVGSQSETLAVGEVLTPDQLHLIEYNGRYGLGANLPGTRYAVAAGHLIRVEADSLRVQSILREQTHVLD